jgi:two-component system, LytTR family, sensor kinase
MLMAPSTLDRTYEFLSRRPVYHTLFWVVVYGALVLADFRQNGGLLHTALTNEAVTLGFYAIVVYTNLRYLIPNYMTRSVPFYIGTVLILGVLVTPVQVLVLYLKLSSDTSIQQSLAQRQGYFFLANIIVALASTELHVIMNWWRFQREKQELMTQNMQSELRFLKSQINPHFLFNTLNNLYALTLTKNDKAPEIVLKLSEIMRYMLYECNERHVFLTKEIHYMQNYLDLERLRQPKDADIVFTTEGHISEQLVAPLLFVPFVENAFKHGLNHHITGGGFVRMHLKVVGEDLDFTIENSKVAISAPRSEHPRSGGIGLNNVRQRLQLLYPNAHVLSVQDDPNQYTVNLHLKL